GPSPPGQASNPTPANSATDVAVNADLSWTAGTGSTSSDVYFGTSSPGSFQGNQTATTYDTGTMSNDTTYYWRIDEINTAGTTTGNVWSFTTIVAAPAQATNPSPADSATNVGINADLNWTAGSGATSHDVYFGATSPGAFQGNQTATTFEPGTMSNNTTYYWRIDELNAAGTTTGNVWSFTTIVAAPGQASSPSPADSATGVSTTADLSWTAGSGATSHDVYFGTSSPGSFQGNQAATTFDTGSMANDTTYYWRVDEVNAGGTTTGSVWSFTTIVAAPAQATNPSPADSATNVSINADLSWTAGSAATSHDVYFGTSSPGSFQGNQTATTYDTGTMSNDTTYYWRIDELNAAGTTTGNVWSFTTVTAGQPVTEEFGDATNTDHPGTVEDTFTNQASGGSVNYSTDVILSTYTWPADTVANTTIIKWDLSSIPTDATVTEATLYLYQLSMAGDTSYDIGVHKIINVNPVISALTWNTYDGTNSWTGGADGGQADTAAAEDTQVVDATNNVYKTWTVTNMAADWVSSPSSNYGMLVNSDDVASVDSCRYFASTEDSNTPYRPKLIVTYISGSPGLATNPDPADSAADVTVDAVLSWTAGSGATSHDVYFGSTSPGAFQGNQTQTSFDPGTLSYNITYYWRIDEVNAGGTTTGNVWSFTTEAAPQPPGQATNPSPADSATNVSINADLSWTAGSGSTSSDVYFGTSSPGSFQGNQTATTFDTGTMANNTTYYWRIDEINADGTTTGNVWSFTTIVAAPAQATNPAPSNSATDVSINANLSWTAGSGATSHDVYFGTDSTPDSGELQGNQTATTFDPGTMANDTTYYWRIDEVNIGGTTAGTVWNFTTEAAPQPPGQASNPNPADSATDVSINADLSWTAGSGSTSSDVYFGTTSPGSFQGNQTATTYDPGTMANDTTYYWRIDEINAVGTTTGNVWSFTTVTGGQVVEEFGDATNTDNPGTIEDTYTNQGGGGSINYSTEVTLNTYTWPADTVANTTIIKWDLSSIPTSATVTEATLYLYQLSFTGDTSYDIGVHKIINVNPVISALTWNTYDGTNSWTGGADGGQSDTAAAEDTQVVDGTNNVYKTWTVTNMVADWVTTPSSNYGMLVNSDDVATIDSCRYFASNEVTNAATRPKLIVTYNTGAAPPGQASNPSPANSATDVSIDADLSWTAGTDSTSSDVYFGTTSPGTYQGNQTATTFDPGSMANDTTYYWRIDEVNAAGTTTGNVWSFTTVAAPAGDVEIIGSWLSGTTHTAESGTNRLLVFTGHVEDNNADMDLTSVTYGGQSMTKVVQQNAGSGYRAYVVAYVLDETGINAASGSDFVVTWAETPSRAPGFSSVFLQNVYQTAPTAATDGNGTESSATLATSALSTNDGDMVFVAGTCGNSGTYSVNNGFTEAVELSIASADAVAGYKAATGASETPSITHSNVNRQVVIGFVVQAE
ncbi:MAG: beta strand repeat-containing protein, partial [Planctomycetota bacterium]